MIIQKGKFYGGLLLSFLLGAVSTFVVTKLLKWSFAIIILAITTIALIWWVKSKLTHKPVKTEEFS